MKLSHVINFLSLILLFLLDFEFLILYTSLLILLFFNQLFNKSFLNKLILVIVPFYIVISVFSISGIFSLFDYYEYGGFELPFSVLIFLPVYSVFNKGGDLKNNPVRETILFLSPLKWLYVFNIKQNQNVKIQWLTIYFFLILFCANEFFFIKSFDFWHEQIEVVGLNSCNTVQALLLFFNNFFKAISPLISFFSFISIANALTKKHLVLNFKKPTYFFFKIIATVLFLSFIGTQNIYYYWMIIKGLINLETVLLYFNEAYVLWPLQMNFITILIFFFFTCLLVMLIKFNHQNKNRNIIFCFLLSIFTFSITQIDYLELYKKKSINNQFQNPNKQYFESLNEKELLRQRNNLQNEPNSFIDMKVRKVQTENLIKDTTSSFTIKTTKLKRFNKFNLDIGSLKPSETFEIRKNEWVTIQFVLISSFNEFLIKDINFRNNVFDYEFYKGEYVFCKSTPVLRNINSGGSFIQKRQKRPKPKGWTLDPLIPINLDAVNLIVPKYQNRIIFLNLFCPDSVESGTYDLKLLFELVEDGQLNLENVNLNVEVIDKVIPKHPKMQTGFSFDPIWINRFYNDSLMFENNAKYYCDFLLNHKITPVNMYYNSVRFPPILMMDSVLRITGGKLCAGYLRQDYKFKSGKYYSFKDLKRNYSDMKEFGLENKVFLNVFDELIPGQEYLLESLKIDLEINGMSSIPVLTTAMGLKDLKEVVDFQCPNIDVFDDEFLETQLDSSWAYFCTSQNSYPYVHIEFTLNDIDVLFEKIKSRKINGLLYWCLNYWKHNVNDEDTLQCFRPKYWNTHTAPGLNGDGMLIYPGKNGELYPSIRLLKIRDGLEMLDY